MKRNLTIFFLAISFFYPPNIYSKGLHFGIISAIRKKVKELNQSPTISSLTANPSSVSPNRTSTITCSASDPDGNTLTYSWTATGGAISGTGSQVTLTAPSTEGIYTITCAVDDGNGGTDKKSVNLEVGYGTKKWEFSTGGNWFSSPAIGSDGIIYVGSLWDNKLYAINPDGTKKWGFVTGGDVDSSPAIDSDGTIYVGSNDNKLYAINPDGTKKWEFVTGGYVTSSPAIGSDGTIYVGSCDNKLYAINPNGTKKWEFITNDYVYSSPAIGSDGTIYVGSWDYKLYAMR